MENTADIAVGAAGAAGGAVRAAAKQAADDVAEAAASGAAEAAGKAAVIAGRHGARSAFVALRDRFRDLLTKTLAFNKRMPWAKRVSGYREMEELLPILKKIDDAGSHGEALQDAFRKGLKGLQEGSQEAYITSAPTAEFWDDMARQMYKLKYGELAAPVRRAADKAAARASVLYTYMATLNQFREGLEAVVAKADGLQTVARISYKTPQQVNDMRRIIPFIARLKPELIDDEVLRHLLEDAMQQLHLTDVFAAKTGFHLATELDDPHLLHNVLERLYVLKWGEEQGKMILRGERMLERH